jgi:rhodanese-related sulfurtransferase
MQHNVLRQIIIIILLVIVTGLLFNYFSGNGLPLIYNAPPSSDTNLISVGQAYLLYQQGQVLFIDTRYPQEFARGHIRQAVNVPARWSMDQIMAFFASISADRSLLVYCSKDCNSGQRLAGFLIQHGYSNVLVLADGYELWLAREYPVELTDSTFSK